jgi:hypothetical protein
MNTPLMVQAEQEFKTTVLSYGRKGMLSLLRAWGFTCHKTKDDNQLAHMLWLLKQRRQREDKREEHEQ